MWLTPNGEYCFSDYSGSLLATGVIRIIENMKFEENTGNPPVIGIELFDRMARGEQIDSLHQLSHALFCDNRPAPALTAYNEVTLVAVIKKLKKEVEAEIVWDDDIIRNYILGVFECEIFDRKLHVDPSNKDPQTWCRLLDEFQGHILHTRIFEDENLETITWSQASKMMPFTQSHPEYMSNAPENLPADKARFFAEETVDLCKEVVANAVERL